MEPMRVLSTHEEVLAALRAVARPNSHNFKAFYNSRLNAIVTDPELMQIPIDDHMVHRSHSVFDTLLVHKGRSYLLKEHLTRLSHCANKAKIELPMPAEGIGSVLKQVATFTGLANCRVRYWLSAGPGNMAIWPEKGMSVLYALAVAGSDPVDGMLREQGNAEITVEIQVKESAIDAIKSTNYILDAMTVLQAASQGGHHGIIADPDGFVTQTSLGHICFLLPDNRFLTPPFDPLSTKSLISRILAYAHAMRETGDITDVEVRKVTLSEAKTAIEVVEVLGDSVIPVTTWDGNQVGRGVPGPIWAKLRDRLVSEMESSDPLYTDLLPIT